MTWRGTRTPYRRRARPQRARATLATRAAGRRAASLAPAAPLARPRRAPLLRLIAPLPRLTASRRPPPARPPPPQSIAPQLFAASLFPYLVFLYFLTRAGSVVPRLTLGGFYFLLVFVGATIPAGIYAKVHYGTSLANVDWLHGTAESLLTITNLLIVLGLREGIRAAEAANAAKAAAEGEAAKGGDKRRGG